MPDFYFPSDKVLDKISSLVQGFWIEKESDGTVVVLMKFEASILTKLIQGSDFEFVFRNPKLSNRSITLYVYDNIKEPLWVTGRKFSNEDKLYLGFDEISIELIKATKIRVAYYTHKNTCIFTTTLTKENNYKNFESWIIDRYRDLEDINCEDEEYFYPENIKKGFSIKIENKDCSEEPKINFFIPNLDKITESNYEEAVDKYNFNDYLKDGKHGYNQEISLYDFLKDIFTVDEELFFSPKLENENELIDFFIIDNDAILLFESKFVLSNKKTKLDKALSKAIEQLNHAENIIKNKTTLIKNPQIKSKIQKPPVIIRVCVYNDSQSLFGGKTKNIISKFSKNELPIFISVTMLFQLIADLKIRNAEMLTPNLIRNFIDIYTKYIETKEDEIIVIRQYKIRKQAE